MSDFNIELKVRNGRLLRMIRAKHGTAAEFSRMSGVSQSIISAYLVMKITPVRVTGEWSKSAYDISSALHCEPEDIWPTHMQRFKMKTNTAEIEFSSAQLTVDGPSAKIAMIEAVKKLGTTLTPREATVLSMRFGGATLDDVSTEFVHATRERVRQIEIKAIRKMGMQAHYKGVKAADVLT
jgi:DNA-directed RNA polymerase sigma subunit (sigma70/sigma32)